MSSGTNKGVGSLLAGCVACFLVVGLVFTGFYENGTPDTVLAKQIHHEAQSMQS
ncbi:hypothetical protein NB640_01650 [Oxalobacter vibrioformis]|uniref:Uncharacterized protein n=1 Tax=Oxalobacter vibrioformis TaxID=933080 RepID=A0A9E9LX98_9BURK|nr:hypothetical protein [Oxalobacter vibrioformis]WAW10397.1 hypothetical protein NB640_01650 [Oxalobacter vibrioformis]